jgi:protein CpxP
MKKMTKIILSAALLPVVLGSAAVMAKGGDKEGNKGGRHEQCGRGSDKGLIKQLDLTAEQKTKIEEMRQANREEMKNDREAKRAEKQAMHKQEQQLVMASDFDEQAAQDLAKQMVDTQAEQRVERLKNRFDMMSVLTPEQKEKLVELQQAQMEKCDMDGDKQGHKNKDKKGNKASN